jgi:transposase InsO family protein
MLFCLLLWILHLAWAAMGIDPPARGIYRRSAAPNIRPRRSPRKPEWVRREVIRLKALLREAGTCRVIADLFCRRFAQTRGMTVGRSFVSEVIRSHRYEIEAMRRQIKNAKPRPVPKNLVWAIDLTGKVTLDGRTQAVLGILEHASRAVLWLEALESKSSWRLIGRLARAIRHHGKPGMLRTDNEAVFTSRSFRFALFVLGIRHRRTDPGCPWQNGRMERFFGSLKHKLDHLAVHSLEALNTALGEYRFFYNHVRSHQNLDGRTPAEAWAGVDPFKTKIRKEYWFEAWDGLLRGYYLRR